jgi:hypothetical protein
MSIIQANKWQTVSGLPVNNIVQMVQVSYNTAQTFTTTTLVDTGLTASITPRFATSKILVLCSAVMSHPGPGQASRGMMKRTGPATAYSIFSQASQTGTVANFTTAQYNSATGSHMQPNSTIQWYDSPASTSACTYTFQMSGNESAGGSVYLNGYNAYVGSWNGVSHLTLWEIAQ